MKVNMTRTYSLTPVDVLKIVEQHLRDQNLIGANDKVVATSSVKPTESYDYYDRGPTTYEFGGIDIKVSENVEK